MKIGTLLINSNPNFMCGCAKIGYKKDLKPGMSAISLDGVLNDNYASLLSWAYCINPQKVKDAYKEKTGLAIENNNLSTLIKAHQLGNDVKVYKVNFLTVLKGIYFTPEERKKSSCDVMLIMPDTKAA